MSSASTPALPPDQAAPSVNQQDTLREALNSPVAQPTPAAPNVATPTAGASALGSALSSIPQQTASDFPRFQRTVGSTLKGMLLGLATGGVPGAVAGGISPTMAAQALQRREASQNAKVQFETAQAAHMVATAAMADKTLQNFDEDHRLEVTSKNVELMKELQSMGVSPVATTSLDGSTQENHDSAVGNLQNLTATHGAVPPLLTLHIGDQAVSYNLNALAPSQGTLDKVNEVRRVQGQDPIAPDSWAQMAKTPQGIAMASDAWQFDAPMPSEGNLTKYKNILANLQNQPASQQKDADVKKYTGIVNDMQRILDEQQKRGVAQKNAEIKGTAGAEASAAGQKAFATAKGSAEGTLAGSGGAKDANGNWNPNSLPVSLVEGNMDPSQLSKRGKDYNMQLQLANQYSTEKYGKPFNIAQAQTDYKYANQGQTQNTLKMIDGMSEPGGAIDIASKAAQNLPQFNSATANKVFNATATEFGNTEASNFHTAMLGLADEYSKVMGGGVSSDTGRQQALDVLKASYSKGQLSGAIQIMQRDIAARKSALIGDNRYLQNQFGKAAAPTQQQQPQGTPVRVNGQIVGYTTDGKTMTPVTH